MFQIGDLVRTSTDRLAIVLSDVGGQNVVCLNVREHDKRAYHRECLRAVRLAGFTMLPLDTV